nr:DUF4245 domain-containing protein [Flexivirga aerilata]
MGSAKNMVISAVVVALACLAWWAFVPRQEKVTRPVADVGGIAREIGIQQHWDPAVADGLPAGWSPVNVRLRTQSGVPPTWQAGYDAPGDGYAAVLQTKDGNAGWVKAQTGSGADKGTVAIAGGQWTKIERSDGEQRSLVRAAPLGGLTTVVTGTGDWTQLQGFAATVKPFSASALATPRSSASSGSSASAPASAG